MARKKRADGRVQVQIDIGREDGVRRRKYFYGRTQKEAYAARDAWLEEEVRRKMATVASPDVTLKDWSELWLSSVDGTTEQATYRQRKSAVNMQNECDVLGKKFGSLRVRDIQTLHVQMYMNSLSGMSKGTIRARRFVLRSVLGYAVTNNIIERTPWIGIKTPKGTYTGHRCLEEAEKRLVLDTCEQHRCGLWAAVMAYTGMRREELAALRVENIDFKLGQISIENAVDMAGTARVKDTKSAAGVRVVPILPQIREPLKRAAEERKSGFLFLSAHGNLLNVSAFKRAWSSYMRFLNLHEGGCDSRRGKDDPITKKHTRMPAVWKIRQFTPHDLRYTYATYLYDAGVDVKTAAYLLGHADITMTMRIYTQLSKRKKIEGIDALLSYSQEDFDSHFDSHD